MALSEDRKGHTYLGTSSACRSCHEDVHRDQFQQDCNSCHTAERWKPASRFSHDRSRYLLSGKHVSVDCARCHNGVLAGTKAVRYTQMAFTACSDCHRDPHPGKFVQQKCSSCHMTEDWRRIEKGRFEHAETRFPLKGKHAAVKCNECHRTDARARNASGEYGFHITRYEKCSSCHAGCARRTISETARRGGLRGVSFGRRFSAGHLHNQRSRFNAVPAPRRAPWGPMQCLPSRTTGTGEEHAPVRLVQSSRLYHLPPRYSQRAIQGENAAGCETCHTVKTWQDLTFSHNNTKFPLNGKHALISCDKCHTVPKGSVADAPVHTPVSGRSASPVMRTNTRANSVDLPPWIVPDATPRYSGKNCVSITIRSRRSR